MLFADWRAMFVMEVYLFFRNLIWQTAARCHRPPPSSATLPGSRTLIATGARTQLGPELYSVFVDAGLPGPSMRMDAVIGGRPDCPAFELTAEVTRSLLPAMEKLKIATAKEVHISNLVEQIRDEVIEARGVVLSPGLIGAWSRKRGIE